MGAVSTWDSELEECEFEVGVDSGQAGVFDDLYYGEDSVFDGFPEPPEDFGSVWYSNCCNITLYDLNAGTIPCGALSSSGYGDGGYPAYSHKGGDGKVDLVAIMFIGEENEEEDDCEDDLEYEQ